MILLKTRILLHAALLLLLFHAVAVHGRNRGYELVTTPVDQAAAEQQKQAILQLSNDLFIPGTFKGSNKESIVYRLLPPAGQDKSRKYPLLVIFHNSGRIGTDNTAQLDVLVKYWAQDAIRKRYPAYVLAVQFPVRSSNYTTIPGNLMTSVAAPCVQSALQLTDSLLKVLPADPHRVYTLGFSMGASTANNAMMARPELFAAGICISGIPAQESVQPLRRMPVWLVHGNKDNENPIPADKAWYKKMLQAKNQQVRFWEIECLEHKIYAPLYTTEALPQWLFAQKR